MMVTLKEIKEEKMRIGVEEKGRVFDPWNYMTLQELAGRIRDEAKEFEDAVMKATHDAPQMVDQDIAKYIQDILYELADVANFVDFAEKRLIKYKFLEESNERSK